MRNPNLKSLPFINLSVSIFLGVFAQLLMKYGMNNINLHAAAAAGAHPAGTGGGASLIGTAEILLVIFSDKFIIAGILLYLISMFFWIKVLSKIDLSVAYPFVSIGIVLTVILAALALGESVPLLRWLGILITLSGVYAVVSSHYEPFKRQKKNGKKTK